MATSSDDGTVGNVRDDGSYTGINNIDFVPPSHGNDQDITLPGGNLKVASKAKGPNTIIQPAKAGFKKDTHPAGFKANPNEIIVGVIDSNDSLFGAYAWPSFGNIAKGPNDVYFPPNDSGGGWGGLTPVKPPSKGGGSQPAPGTTPPPKTKAAAATIIKAVIPDAAYRAILVDTDQNSIHAPWNAFPIGTAGLAVSMGRLDSQIIDFYPTDPRLCSVNKSGATDCGSMVYDVDTSANWDDTRGAPLQSLCRVLKSASPTGNTLAINIGYSGQADALGGLMIDSRGTAGHYTCGALSDLDGGPFHTGQLGEPHTLGKDRDGNIINSMHLTTSAMIMGGTFDSVNGPNLDGPIRYEGAGKLSENKPPYQTKVDHFFDFSIKYNWTGGKRYGPKKNIPLSGMWGWQGYCFQRLAAPPTTPSGPPSGPPVSSPPKGPVQGIDDRFFDVVPGIDAYVPGPLGPGFGYDNGLTFANIKTGNSQIMHARGRGFSFAEIGESGSVGQPIPYIDGQPDMRYSEGWKANPDLLDELERTSPTVGRLSWLGAQGKGALNGWLYNQKPGLSRELGGTAAGTLALIPPEFDLTDASSNFTATNISASKVYFTAVPGARMGSGIPDVVTGGLKSGFSFGHQDGSFSSDYVIYKHDSSAAVTEFLRFSARPTANQVLAAPADGSTGVATFRSLVKADITGADSLVYANTTVPAGNTINNTDVEVAFESKYTIPANSLTAGQVIKVSLRGTYSTAVLAPTITGRIRYGGLVGTLLITSGTISALVGATSDRGWHGDATFIVDTIGGSGTIEAQASMQFATAASAALTILPVNTSTIVFDSATTSDLVATVQWGTADSSNSITLREMVVEILG